MIISINAEKALEEVKHPFMVKSLKVHIERICLNTIKAIYNTNTWRINNMLLINQWITEEIKEEIKKYLDMNDNKNMTTQNLWGTAKAVLRGKFTAI